jgi:hypothetical protein
MNNLQKAMIDLHCDMGEEGWARNSFILCKIDLKVTGMCEKGFYLWWLPSLFLSLSL